MSAAQLELDRTPVWERGMNPEQLAAIRHQDGPCALLAQAGSGKTRALVHRIARMVAEGVDPASILAVTFSKKAADEMNERLEQLSVEGARVGTWHSLCLQILKDDKTEWAGWDLDKTDRAKFLLKDILGYKMMRWEKADLGKVTRYIGLCKANLADPGSDFAIALAEEQFSVESPKAVEAYEIYQRLIEERGMLTFDDFLTFTHRHLAADEGHRLKWAGRWEYMLQDEAQDASLAQETIAEMLCRGHRNYLVVGDTAQAIYSFRGSKPEYLMNFAGVWGAETIIMNRNYRSGRAIVDAANRIIAPAAIRLPTDMIAERDHEGTVRVVKSVDLDEEGVAFAQWVYELTSAGQPLHSMCALFRTNAQSRALEEALIAKQIPYVIIGGTTFYERKEVKDLLGYLRVACDRDPDGEAARRCVNAPFRYLGAAFVERLTKGTGDDWTQRVLQAAEGAGIQKRQRESALEWVAIVTAAKRHVEQDAKPADVLNGIINRTGYITWLEKDHGAESLDSSHAANVREMARIAEKFATTRDLLDYVDEMTRAASKKQRGDRVLLMSIHRSKGLEWPNVWVSGCNEDVLPHKRGDLEEERRLLYVAATRARDNLVLSYVTRFAARQGVMDAQPSRFLREAGLVK